MDVKALEQVRDKFERMRHAKHLALYRHKGGRMNFKGRHLQIACCLVGAGFLAMLLINHHADPGQRQEIDLSQRTLIAPKRDSLQYVQDRLQPWDRAQRIRELVISEIIVNNADNGHFDWARRLDAVREISELTVEMIFRGDTIDDLGVNDALLYVRRGCDCSDNKVNLELWKVGFAIVLGSKPTMKQHVESLVARHPNFPFLEAQEMSWFWSDMWDACRVTIKESEAGVKIIYGR